MNDYTTPGANETESYTATVIARDVQAGDLVNGNALVSKKVGTKWVHLTWDTGVTTKHEPDEDFLVEREQLTEAAKKIRNREYAEQSLARLLDKHRDHEATVVKVMNEAVVQVTGEKRYTLSSQMDYLMDVAVQRAKADLWRGVLWMFDDEESATRGDAIATFRKAQKIFTKDLVEGGRYSSGPLSRSSSTMSNLAEDIERHERVKFLDDIKWEMNALDNS